MKVKDVLKNIRSNRIAGYIYETDECVIDFKDIKDLTLEELEMEVDDYSDYWFVNECEVFLKNI